MNKTAGTHLRQQTQILIHNDVVKMPTWVKRRNVTLINRNTLNDAKRLLSTIPPW